MATLAIRYSKGTPANSFTTALWLHSSTGTYDEGWKIRYDGWTQGVTQFINGEWTNAEERVTMRIIGTSANDLSNKLIKIDELVQDIQFHLNANSNRVYWLFTAMDNEAAPLGDENYQSYRICPIIGIASSFNEGLFKRGGTTVLQYTIIIKRLPFWEGVNYSIIYEAYTALNISEGQFSISTVGGKMTFSDTVEGTAPARITRFRLASESGGGGPMTQAWFGFRSAELGTPANFVPVWELEDAGTLGDDTTVVSESSDTSPSGSTTNNKLQCTFATDQTMDTRAVIKVGDVTANVGDQRGRHLVLLRAKVTDTRTAYVRMDSAYTNATSWRTGTRMLVDSTSWLLYPIGYITIPATRLSEFETLYGGGPTFNNFAIRIGAQDAGGSGNLEMDCLVLIPQDEGAVYINNASMEYTGGVSGEGILGIDPFGNSYAVDIPSFAIEKGLEAQFEHFALPNGNGNIGVLAAQRATSQVLIDTLWVSFYGRFRWRSLRGMQGVPG